MPHLSMRAVAMMPLLATACAAWAQADQAQTLNPVVVIGRKNPDQSTLTQPDLPTARQRIELTPGGAGVIDADSYTDGRVSTLADALGGATGVYVQPRFGSEEARISIRGSGLQRTFHGRGLKLMQDGVPLNLADGSFDFQAVEALSARYVEVWRGANALQYGSSTLGGAVNFVSPNGYNSDVVRLRGEVGSFGYSRAQASTGNVVGAFDYYLSASSFHQDGFRQHARQQTGRLFANLGYQLATGLETRFYLGLVDSDSDLPGAITRAQLERDPRAANPGNVTGDQQRDIRWTRLSNKTVYRRGARQIEFFAYASDKELSHPIFQVLDQHSVDVGAELRYVDEEDWGGRRNRLTLGIAPSHGATDEVRSLNVGGRPGAQTNASRQVARNVELYAENQHYVRPDMALIVGLQHVRSRRKLDDRFVAGTPADPLSESFDLRYDGTSPKVGLRYDVTKDVQIFANWSRSFESPSFGELAGGPRPTLNVAQKARTLEVGTRGRVAALEWDVVLYESRLRDELLQIAINDLGASTTVNADKTLHRGVELGLAGEVLRSDAGSVQWRVNALWNRFRFRGDPEFGNTPLPGVPKTFGRAELAYRFASGSSLALHVEGASRYAVDFANSLHAHGYGIWGLRAGGALGRGIDWFVDGRNLSNRKYAATTGVVRDAQGQDIAQFFPGDGRSVYAGIDWKFN